MEPTAPLCRKDAPAKPGRVLGQAHLVGPKPPSGGSSKTTVSVPSSSGVRPASARRPLPRSSLVAPAPLHPRQRGERRRRRPPQSRRRSARSPEAKRGSLCPGAPPHHPVIDEIHRFNKAQQDSVLPHVGERTANPDRRDHGEPSFEVNAALLSRARVYTLNSLTDEEIGVAIDAALTDEERGLQESNSRTRPAKPDHPRQR